MRRVQQLFNGDAGIVVPVQAPCRPRAANLQGEAESRYMVVRVGRIAMPLFFRIPSWARPNPKSFSD